MKKKMWNIKADHPILKRIDKWIDFNPGTGMRLYINELLRLEYENIEWRLETEQDIYNIFEKD